MAAAAMTASPYLVALRAAAMMPGGGSSSSKGQREQREAQDYEDDEAELCFICGSLAPAGQAYCSDACRAQDDAPSPPAPTAVPGLVSSSRRGLRSDGSASSPPSSLPESGAEEEDEIEKLVLGPSQYSYSTTANNAKKNPFASPYSYNLTGSTGSPALVAKSPTKSPVVRPVSSALATGPAGRNSIGGLLSPQYGPVQTRRPSTAPSHAATASSAPIQPVEDLTFRRRFHPEGAKQQQQSAVSPALLASRRRSSNLPSPLLLARNQTSPPSARRVSSSSSSSESSPVPASSNKPQTAAQASLSRLLHGTKSPSFGAKSPSSATLKAQASSSRKLLPLNSTHHIISAPSSNAQHFGSRRVSEPLSPYYSPSIRSPSSGDIFASAFAGKPSSYSPSHRRPSISASWSAPVIPDSSPLASSVATTRPQDYSGFAGFLESKHANRASPTVSPTTTLAATKHRGSDGTESGYDAQDEQLSLQKDRRLASSTNKKAVSPVTSRRALAEVSNGLREAQQKSHASIMKERLANLHNGANGSSASSSSSDGSNAPSKVKGYHFSRGGAFKGSLHDEEQEDEEDESSRRGRRSRQSTVKATQQQQATSTAQSNSRTRQSSATAVQDADYVVTVLPSNKHSSSATAKPESAVLTSSSSSSSSEEEENARGRGRAVRTTSSDYTERRQLVSPFTALERAAAGLPHQQPPPARPASRQAPLERGRSMQRSSSHTAQRSQRT